MHRPGPTWSVSHSPLLTAPARLRRAGRGQTARLHEAHRLQHGLGNRTLPEAAAGPPAELAVGPAPELGRVRWQLFLSGLLRHYCRAAA